MPLTVIVRSGEGAESRLTFDGTQRVVLGRGAGCDVRLPDASVSVRHASVRAQGADFVLLDEGSTNGTFVGDVRVAPHTSRLIRSGEVARLGRVWIELRIDRSPITRDLAAATRDLALAMVAQVLDATGQDRTVQVVVVEGRDQGAALALAVDAQVYVVGRAPDCDLPLADPDASRQAAEIQRRGASVLVRDLGGRNGAWLGDVRVPGDHPVAWRGAQMLRLGRSVLALREPVGLALASIEQAPDEPIAPGQTPEPPPSLVPAAPALEGPPAPAAAPITAIPVVATRPAKRSGWSATDFAVMALAGGVLVLSVAALVWLLSPSK